MTKKKLKAIFVLFVASIICLSVITLFTGLVYIAFPLFILLGTILVGWAIKECVEWLIKNIDYKQIAAKTVEHTKAIAKKVRIEEGKKIIYESINELRGKNNNDV